MNFKTTLLATALTALTAPAFAGGLAQPSMEMPVYTPPSADMLLSVEPMIQNDWNGGYVGVTLGGVSQSDPDGSGFDLGAHAGYNMQMGSIVVGAEVGINPIGYDLDDNGDEMNSAFNADMKAGYPMGDLMPYATVGMVYQNGSIGGEDVSDTGVSFGAGVDYKLTNNLILGGQYKHTGIDDFDDTGVDVSKNQFSAKLSLAF